jgi:hypothetical protein
MTGSAPPTRAILHGPWRERNRGQGRTLPHGYRCHLRSSGLADARCVIRFAWAIGSSPRRLRRSARHGRAQLRYRRNGGFRRGAGRLSHLCRKATGRMAYRFDVGTAANAKASHAPAKLYFDIQWPRPVWACVLGQAATESCLRYRPHIAPQWSVQVGGFLTVEGINAGRELGPTAGVWYRF